MISSFSQEKIRKIDKIIDGLVTILNKSGFYTYDRVLLDIKKYVESKNIQELIPVFNTNALFGGAGALWEIYIENGTDRLMFLKLFIDLINQFKEVGIQDKRIDEVSNALNLILKSY